METNNFSVGTLDVHVFDCRSEMGKAAAADAEKRINAILNQKGEATIVFAAAPSQNDLLEALLTADVDWSKVRALHQDEYVGLPKDAPAGFGNFLDRAIFSKVHFKEIYYLYNEDAQNVCARYEEIIRRYPPDMIFLGVGENGHLAFNDPLVADFEDPKTIKLVELDDVCRMQQVNDGCFSAFNEVPKTAATLTMSAILKIPEAITVVPGTKKAAAINAALTGPVTTDCPASVLRQHPNAALYLDADSAQRALETMQRA